MQIIKGSGIVPVFYTAHHASHDFGEFVPRLSLTPEQQLRFSDYGTAETVPTNGIVSLTAEKSRALGDLNRDPDDPERFQLQDYGKPERHNIWKPGQELTESEKQYCQESYYQPFHEEIVNQLRNRSEPTFVVSWDNTAHYEIGNDSNGKPVIMKPFILSNRGLEGSAYAGADEETSCDPVFLEILAKHFAYELKAAGLPNEIHLNLVFRGGYICRRYSTRRNKAELNQLGINSEVQSLQLEYDTSITHDQDTLEPKLEKMQALKEAFSKAIEKSCSDYLQDLKVS